jgi:hypothetical protein
MALKTQNSYVDYFVHVFDLSKKLIERTIPRKWAQF